MTALEKLKKEYPESIDEDGFPYFCPSSYNYLTDPEYCNDSNYGTCQKRCTDCWHREIPENAGQDIDGDKAADIVQPSKKMPVDYVEESPHILDSGNRRQFESGAVRDIQEGKGRCDLMPLDIVAEYFTRDGQPNEIFWSIHRFQENGNTSHLSRALDSFNEEHWKNNRTMFLEVSKHFEDGAKKYGENNWQKGIPVHCYIDSAVRHYLKFLRGDKDEPHDRAFCWNILCAIWTCKHKPELNEYGKEH